MLLEGYVTGGKNRGRPDFGTPGGGSFIALKCPDRQRDMVSDGGARPKYNRASEPAKLSARGGARRQVVARGQTRIANEVRACGQSEDGETLGHYLANGNPPARRRGDRVTRFRYLLHLLRSPIGTWPTRSDVRDYGEYWRVSGPSAKCSGHFVRGVPRQLDLNRYGAERPRRAVASGLRTPAWRRARQSSPLASRRRTPDG